MDKFIKEVAQLISINLTENQIESFRIFETELLSWNEKFNLTAIREINQIRSKHFLDSLTCSYAFNGKKPGRLIDIGTGAGFPGIPLKILFPHMHLTLVESIGKKTRFCEHIVSKLKLENVTVIQSRAEDLGQDGKFREKYDWAVARAVANLPILVEYLLPLVKIGGSVIAQKGESAPAEANQASHAIHILGGRLRHLLPVMIPGVVEERFLIVVDKVAATPKMYPRITGIPSKKPLK
ncbi:MAG: 16S rRNA (guanine(527)-N(7))-methyltransferase RsmG [Anaerolineaceae bacterium]|nr:16S rRNA (guanine(527)-N(7))-methyltransferase RsmG [Anaerolineaceae bacterium]